MNPENFNHPTETEHSAEHRQKVYALVHEITDKIHFYPAANIAGFDDDEAWKIREDLRDQEPGGVAQGLAGLTSERAWKMRSDLMASAPHSVARSLVGLDTVEAWNMREELGNMKDREGVGNGLAESVVFLDDDRAWAMRTAMETEYPLNVLESLIGLDSDRAWSMREKYKETHPREVAASLIGIHNERANEWRKNFLDSGMIDGVILSYMADDSTEAWQLREQYWDTFPFVVGTSMAHLENDRSWEMRAKLKTKAEQEHSQVVYKGLAQSLSPYIATGLQK